ncbi:MAG: hypothetical protein AAFY20_00455 [Cyanobacteria bacterium J06639_14]
MTAEELLQRYQAGERNFRGVRLRGIISMDRAFSTGGNSFSRGRQTACEAAV